MSEGKVIHVLSGAEYDLYIGRAMPRYKLDKSSFANPFKIGRDGDRDEVLRKFEERQREIFAENPSLVVSIREMLRRGAILACWCAPRDGTPLTLDDPEICHGQTWIRLAWELS